jgi:hypothetical protein
VIEEFLVAGIVAIAIVVVAGVVLFQGKSNRVDGSLSKGPDSGGTFGGIPNIAPGVFDPGTAPPPTYEVTEHVRAYDEQSKPAKEP